MFMLSKLNVQTRPSSFGHDLPALPFGGRNSLGCAVLSRGGLRWRLPAGGDLTSGRWAVSGDSFGSDC